ncbi:MAG TPA: Fic family protein [Hyphomicrobiales bacterium]|nr:Fic family protein [Hyphomicrobiales bacterium]
MDEPVRVNRAAVLALYGERLAEHGGSAGVRDAGFLDSALARRRRNAFAYGTPDLADLAAAYRFGLARNHPFVDGNKRVAGRDRAFSRAQRLRSRHRRRSHGPFLAGVGRQHA